jgi:hypothetical protein
MAKERGAGECAPGLDGTALSDDIRRCTFIDAAIILIMICGAALSLNLAKPERPNSVVVFRQNAVVAEYPLRDDVTFAVSGKIGPLEIEVKNGAAKITRTSCPRQICKRSGSINGRHGQLICAPNNILIRIRSPQTQTDNGADAIAY